MALTSMAMKIMDKFLVDIGLVLMAIVLRAMAWVKFPDTEVPSAKVLMAIHGATDRRADG